MAKSITQFQAEDGSIHATMDGAMEHDRRLVELATVMSSMPRVNDPDLIFANGGGYKDWPIHVVREVRAGIMRLARSWASWIFRDESGKPVDSHPGFIGRALSDSDTSPGLYGHYMRLFFDIDEAGREYGQQYYRNNPGECKRKVFE